MKQYEGRMSKDVRKAVKGLMAEFGGELGVGKDHAFLRLPNGRKVTLPRLVMCPRTLLNLKSQIGRAAAGLRT